MIIFNILGSKSIFIENWAQFPILTQFSLIFFRKKSKIFTPKKWEIIIGWIQVKGIIENGRS